MWPFDDTLKTDLENICAADFVPWEMLRGKTIFVSGATGLIGYTTVQALICASQIMGLGLKAVVLVRDEKRARKRFKDIADKLVFVKGNIEELPEVDIPIDYIVHGASQTASKAFVEQPVETIFTAVKGTENMLRLAADRHVKSMVYLSSMEMYGFPNKGHKVTEEEAGAFSPLEMRNSYPISKLLCENLCCAYAKEYGVPAKILRLTQTFGPGVNYNDGRIFAEFARCVLEKKDIVLKTKGETERSYLYTADAATAILTVLLKGEAGQAYNAADEGTYCSIADMALNVAKLGGIGVRYDIEETGQHKYPRPLYMNLDTSKLKSLGWQCRISGGGKVTPYIREMYARMISAMKNVC